MKESGIYRITCTENNKVYLGSSIYLNRRKWQHTTALKNNKSPNRPLQEDYNLYGPEKFTFEVVEIVSDLDSLIIREQHWMDFYKSKNPELVYNLAPKAGSNKGFIFPIASKALVSAGKIGHKMTPEQAKAHGERQKGVLHNHKLTPDQALEIITRWINGEHRQTIAEAFDINPKSVNAIVKRKTWTTLKLPPEIEARLNLGMDGRTKGNSNFRPKGIGHSKTSLSEETIRLIKGRLARGDAINCIAKDFSLKPYRIMDIKAGRVWSHITDFTIPEGEPVRARKPQSRELNKIKSSALSRTTL